MDICRLSTHDALPDYPSTMPVCLYIPSIHPSAIPVRLYILSIHPSAIPVCPYILSIHLYIIYKV